MREVDDLVEPPAKQILLITPADSRESPNLICKETARQKLESCKFDYLTGRSEPSRSMRWEFFTHD